MILLADARRSGAETYEFNMHFTLTGHLARMDHRMVADLTPYAYTLHFGQDELALVGGKITALKAADLAVGVPFKNVAGATDAGAVIVIYGSHVSRSNGLVSTNSQFWTQNSPGMPCCSDAGDHFGASLY